MKILMISIFSQHFFNWTEQLKNSGHEIYWLDVYDSNTHVKKIDFIHQITGWRYKWNYPGRYSLKKGLPFLNKFINKWNERKLEKVFEEKLVEIKPDVVHSFALYVSCTPIIKVMEKYAGLKWMYSSWGSDLFYFQNDNNYLKDIQRVLPRVNYLFTDCKRDLLIASEHGFRGDFLGVFPGGGGYNLEEVKNLEYPHNEKKVILIKGYQGRSGRAVSVLKAILNLEEILQSLKIVVFGADNEVIHFINKTSLSNWENVKVEGKISHTKVLKLMGQSLIYIGNSISDGMPNTLLEAIIMETFPIQSNPGGATAEIIEHGKNGFLINDPENSKEIAALIKKAIENPQLMKSAVQCNTQIIKPKLKRDFIKKQVLEKYKLVEQEINK